MAFATPSVFTMAVLLVLPLGYTLVWSFQQVSYGTEGAWVGLSNYVQSLSTPRFLSAISFTSAFTGAVTVLLVVIGYGLALLLFAVNKHLRTVFLCLIMISYVVPLVVGALAFAWLFNNTYGGPLDGLLRAIGLNYYWLDSVWPARVLVVIETVWSQAAFPALVLLAGLNTVDSNQIEAARLDGASWFQTQRFVVIPHLRKLFALIILICVMDNLRVFDQIQMITPSAQNLGTESLMVYVYDVALGNSQQLGLASAISVMTMVITFIVLLPLLINTYRDLRSQ
ncbi:carbohydrate ABC transporter permease [Arthrobacter sp. SO3]|uniref:carbohydrate ABC transporter permease n=1 Tax=Arthrobacter sp. SO3 TaxID=1897057 RepID=UPI001CFF648B|nr:sugar ABC transporter permease [Arthrobacter sp. SO3]